jgi:hypothetical protein
MPARLVKRQEGISIRFAREGVGNADDPLNLHGSFQKKDRTLGSMKGMAGIQFGGRW